MKANRKILIFIPTYNDFLFLPSIIGKLKEMLPTCTIIVIDDGSNKKNDFIPEGYPIVYHKVPKNYGIGLATNIAFDYALSNNFDIVLRLDSDNQHPISEIYKILNRINDSGANLIAGVRSNAYPRGLNNILKNFLKKYFSFVTYFVTTKKIADVNTGFIALNYEAINIINKFNLQRYPEPQIFLIAGKKNILINEFTITQNQRIEGQSSLNAWKALKMFLVYHIFLFQFITKRQIKQNREFNILRRQAKNKLRLKDSGV